MLPPPPSFLLTKEIADALYPCGPASTRLFLGTIQYHMRMLKDSGRARPVLVPDARNLGWQLMTNAGPPAG